MSNWSQNANGDGSDMATQTIHAAVAKHQRDESKELRGDSGDYCMNAGAFLLSHSFSAACDSNSATSMLSIVGSVSLTRLISSSLSRGPKATDAVESLHVRGKMVQLCSKYR